MKTRLQRFLADCGVASRRECEAMIQGGRVRVNGEVRTNMPVMVEPETDVITVDEMEVGGTRSGGASVGKMGDALTEQAKVYFLLNKPKGILVTASDPKDRKTVHELMNHDYVVHVVQDAIASRSQRNKEIGWDKMVASGAVPSCVEIALFEMLGESGTEQFKAVQRLVK